MLPPKELIDFLKREDDFLIATHYSPDADGLGSALALSMALGQLGKKTTLLDHDPVPQQCRFLPGSNAFTTFEEVLARGDFRNLVLVDCNDLNRLTGNKALTSALRFGTSAVIDHHESERPFGDLRWVEPDAPATGMMVYYIIKALGRDITPDMAMNIYAAVCVDTGNFRHPNTTADALRIAYEMAEAGATPYAISQELYDSWSDGRFRLFGRMLNSLEIRDSIAIVTVTRQMLDETCTTAEDTENFVEFPRIMKKIEVSVLLRETSENNCKVSLRSKGGTNVARVAEAFGGGGHRNAAGCNIKADPETAKKMLLEKIAAKV